MDGASGPNRPLPSRPCLPLPPRAVLISPERDARQALSERPLVFRFRPSPLMFPPVLGRGGAIVSRMPPGAKERTSRKGDRARVVGTDRAPGEGGPRPGSGRAGRRAHGRRRLLPQSPALTPKRTCWAPHLAMGEVDDQLKNCPSGFRQKAREARS